MQNIYFDNAATTPVHPEVLDSMYLAMRDIFGNPSSTHQTGRKGRSAVERIRKNMARLLNAQTADLIFTSGGTEANNFILRGLVSRGMISRIITSALEHPSVLKTIEDLKSNQQIEVDYVKFDRNGSIDLQHLETLLKSSDKKSLVSLMWVQNELGNILDTDTVSRLCRENGALFHTDSVQAIGHIPIDLQNTPVDFITGSAHKFHGPKGIGFAYVRDKSVVKPLITGGEQEKGLRAGTENVPGIIGMGKAFEIANSDFETSNRQLGELKAFMVAQLKKNISGIEFNGLSADPEKSAPHILNIRFPKQIPMLLFKLDMQGISVSGGSACQSGSQKASHVLSALLSKEKLQQSSVRISFSRFNTLTEIDRVVEALRNLSE